MEKQSELKYLGGALDESGTDVAEFRSLVNAMGLQLESLLVSILL